MQEVQLASRLVPNARLQISALVATTDCGIAQLSLLGVPGRSDVVSTIAGPGPHLRSVLYEDKIREEVQALAVAYGLAGMAGSQLEAAWELQVGEGSPAVGEVGRTT